MTSIQYQRRIVSYLKGNPSDAALKLIAYIVSDWTESGGSDDSGDKLHTEIFGPPWTCPECEETWNFYDECWSCDTKRPEV